MGSGLADSFALIQEEQAARWGGTDARVGIDVNARGIESIIVGVTG
jgi:hypothetical protein